MCYHLFCLQTGFAWDRVIQQWIAHIFAWGQHTKWKGKALQIRASQTKDKLFLWWVAPCRIKIHWEASQRWVFGASDWQTRLHSADPEQEFYKCSQFLLFIEALLMHLNDRTRTCLPFWDIAACISKSTFTMTLINQFATTQCFYLMISITEKISWYWISDKITTAFQWHDFSTSLLKSPGKLLLEKKGV